VGCAVPAEAVVDTSNGVARQPDQLTHQELVCPMATMRPAVQKREALAGRVPHLTAGSAVDGGAVPLGGHAVSPVAAAHCRRRLSAQEALELFDVDTDDGATFDDGQLMPQAPKRRSTRRRDSHRKLEERVANFENHLAGSDFEEILEASEALEPDGEEFADFGYMDVKRGEVWNDGDDDVVDDDAEACLASERPVPPSCRDAQRCDATSVREVRTHRGPLHAKPRSNDGSGRSRGTGADLFLTARMTRWR
jgi:hypothetical protein